MYEEPVLDFSRLEKACGLSFNEDQRQAIRGAAGLYLLLASPAHEQSDPGLKRELERIAQTAERAAQVLRGVSADTTEAAASQIARGPLGLQAHARAVEAATLLSEVAARAHEHAALLDVDTRQPGRPRETPRDALIVGLARVWRQAGGRAFGPNGPFARLVRELLAQLEGPTVGLADAIRRLRRGKTI